MCDQRTVLIIDDDHEIVRGVSVRLRAAGYDVIAAHDGREGLAMASSETPDAIVLDVRMPVMDGIQVLSNLKKDAATTMIPVVILSASTHAGADRHALDLGARYFLEKPYDAKMLIEAVRVVLDGPDPSLDSK